MVVVDGSVVAGSVVVVGGTVVVVVCGVDGAVVVVVAVGWVVVVAGTRVVGVVVEGGNNTESGSVETFDDLALAGSVGIVDFFRESVVELVVVGLTAGFAVVVVVARVVGGSLAGISPTVWPCTSSGRSSWCTTTNKPATTRTLVVTQLHCSNRRRPEVTVATL